MTTSAILKKKTIQHHETNTYQYLVSLNNRGTSSPNCVMVGKRVPPKLREKTKKICSLNGKL